LIHYPTHFFKLKVLLAALSSGGTAVFFRTVLLHWEKRDR
jgi:hypothetical protein